MPKVRNSSGALLIELLAALVVATILLLGLYESIALYMRLTVVSEERELAAFMAQEVVERVKNIPFDSPDLAVGKTYNLVINDFKLPTTNLPAIGSTLRRPLLLDTTNLQYSTQVANTASAYHKFIGDVSLTVSDGPIYTKTGVPVKDTKTALVSIDWFEPGSTEKRTLRVSTLLYRYGLNHNGS
ncbi:MAG: hypothetical protein Q8T09_15040 [Candidatus Melainabacteria bacterium]|nr:hypothetical protein [Candidatus Melainabacteria bacterium]